MIIFGPGGSQGAVEGTPLWQTPIPYQNTADTPNIGTWAQTDDTRIGMGLEGLMHLRQFIDAGGAFIASNSSAEFAINNNFTYGVSLEPARARPRASSARCCARSSSTTTSPIVYGVPDNLADLQRQRRDASASARPPAAAGAAPAAAAAAARPAAGAAAAGGGRPTGRGTPDDPDVVQGRASVEGTNLTPRADAACRCSRGSTRCRPRSS